MGCGSTLWMETSAVTGIVSTAPILFSSTLSGPTPRKHATHKIFLFDPKSSLYFMTLLTANSPRDRVRRDAVPGGRQSERHLPSLRYRGWPGWVGRCHAFVCCVYCYCGLGFWNRSRGEDGGGQSSYRCVGRSVDFANETAGFATPFGRSDTCRGYQGTAICGG